MLRTWTCALISMGLVSLALGVAACDKDDNDDGDGGGGGAWLVGEDGAMYNVGPLHAGDYEIDVGADLLDIACRGSDRAWVVGERGTLLRTFDAGVSWQSIDLATTRTLQAVAASWGEAVFVVGDGIALVSPDSGDSWTEINVDEASLTAVATFWEGQSALFGAADGRLWRYDGELSLVHQAPAGIRSLSMSHDGRIAVAVGDGGLVLRSIDGGTSWRRIDVAVTADLHDVWVTADGARALMVGDRGTFIELDDAGSSARQLAEAVALRGIHLSADGAGLMVGDQGTALRTDDGGASWSYVDLGTTRTLHAVDDIHADASHL